MCLLLIGTISGTRVRATLAGADRLPVRLGYGYRWRPLSEFAGTATRTRTPTPTAPIKHHRTAPADARNLAHGVMAARRPAATPETTELMPRAVSQDRPGCCWPGFRPDPGEIPPPPGVMFVFTMKGAPQRPEVIHRSRTS